MPLCHKINTTNRNLSIRLFGKPAPIPEPKTLKEALDKLGAPSEKKPTVVFDAGIATKENLAYLREEGYSYIVASRSRSCE